MANLAAVWAVPVFVAAVLVAGIIRKVPVFDEFTAGAGEGLRACVKVLPSLAALMTAVSMLRASGAMELLTAAVAPLAQRLGFPPEVIPLALLRPVSGSGSLAMLENVYATYGADGLIGRVASVLQSSTETTFYTIAVYYGAVGVKRTRHTLAAAAGGESREKASGWIRAGNVSLNHREELSVSAAVEEGDVLSIRGKGRFVIDRLGPVTKKGRLSIVFRKYV